MTTLFPEIEHGEGGDTAAEGRTVLAVAVRRGVRKARDKEAAEALPKAKEDQRAEAESGMRQGVGDGAGNARRVPEWDGAVCCYWLVYPHSVHAVSHQLAAKFSDAGKVVTLGTWADAEAVRQQMENNERLRAARAAGESTEVKP